MKSNWRSGYEEGIKEGIRVRVHTLKDLSFSKEDVSKKLMEAYLLLDTEAEAYIKEYWKG